MSQETATSSKYQVLQHWLVRFPDQRVALARLFATWAVQSALPEEESVEERAIGQHMVGQALRLLCPPPLAHHPSVGLRPEEMTNQDAATKA
jgi:hypothetical protein